MRAPQWLLEATVLCLAAVLLCFSKPTDKRGVLLPPSLEPEHYEISLAPQADKGVFHGVVVISGLAVADTDRIILHCKNLLFNTTTLTDLTIDEEVEVEDIEEDVLLQQCHLFLNQSLQVGHEYRLSMEFMGFISRDGVGLYRDVYKENGVRREILMTHFQPNYARAMFPCFDEPHLKAQFLLRVTHQPFPTVISNMPVSQAALPDPGDTNQTWVEFEETPQMSTYLLVLVMCDYLALSDSTTNTSVWAPRSRLHEAQLALNVSVAVLEYCERYFGVEYTLPKLDHIPVHSLNTVAMENWGAITYQADFLLWEEGVSTSAQREMISHVICHEVIHQWLGNLVTTTWWNTTWLNEGITSFYHYYIMDKVEPSWKVMDNMFVSQILLILNEEAMKDPKPLTNNEPLHQDAISTQAFSASTYLKGAAIIRMVFNLMAPDIFREAMSQYIRENQFGSVDEVDLWQTVATVADLPIDLEEVMYSWTHQPGYPLVTVVRGPNGCISVHQEKYLGKDEADARWTIPLTYTTSTELDFNFSSTVWFPDDVAVVELEVCLEPTDWILLNVRQTGFYRVNYDAATWRILTFDLQNCDVSDIHPVNRAQLLNDGFDLARHGLLEYPVILELSRYLERESEYLPWSVAIQWFNFLRARLLETDFFVPFQQYVLELVEGEFSQMSLTGEVGGLLQEFHRKQIVEFACGLQHPRCVKEATDAVYLLMSGVSVRIPQDLKPVLLCAAVKYGQDEVWHFVVKEYLSAVEKDRWKYLVALACTTKEETIDRLLKDISSPGSFVKNNDDRLLLMAEMGKQDGGLDNVLDMILSKFHVLAANFDLEVVLQLFKSFMPPALTQEERDKIYAIAALVGKTRVPKHIELMDSIVADANRPDLDSVQEEMIKQWFIQEAENDESGQTSSLSPSFDKDMPATTDGDEKEPISATSGSIVPKEDSKEKVDDNDDDEEEEEGNNGDEDDDGDDVKDDSGESTGKGESSDESNDDDGGSSNIKPIKVLFVLSVLFFCIMR